MNYGGNRKEEAWENQVREDYYTQESWRWQEVDQERKEEIERTQQELDFLSPQVWRLLKKTWPLRLASWFIRILLLTVEEEFQGACCQDWWN